MRLAWATDIHLDFVAPPQIDKWLVDSFADNPADALLITGDIGESHSLIQYLTTISERLDMPVYFVLGNHDYYRGSVDGVRSAVRKLCETKPRLQWLPDCGIISLSAQTALVGHGGWSDGGYGEFLKSNIVLNDYLLIADLAVHGMNLEKILTKIEALGKEAADYLAHVLPQAAEKHQQVYIATHSPPFQETAWYEGKTPSEDDPYLPHFTCKAIGDVLLKVAKKYTDTQFTVLCGHTHGEGEREILANLRVITGGAEYTDPQIKRIFEVD